MQADYGVNDDLENDELAQMNHAECLLALYILFREKDHTGIEEPIDFIDADKLATLKGR